MKKSSILLIKIFVAISVIMTVFLIGENQVCFADDLSVSSILQRGDSFISQGSASTTVTTDSVAADFLPIGRVLVGVATAVLFIVTAIMGIRWITASPDQQATLKKQLIGLVVSIVVIYGAVGIWTLVRQIMEGLTA